AGELDAAEELMLLAVRACRTQGNRLMEGGAVSYLAAIALARGDLATAERHALATIAVAGEAAQLRASADAPLAPIRLAQGATDEALVAARAASVALTKAGERALRKGLVRLVLAEALHAAGHDEEARAVLRDARDRILARAAELDDGLRADFLSAQPDHAQ